MFGVELKNSETKVCNKCKYEKSINDFYVNKSKSRYGKEYTYLRNTCKECERKSNSHYFKNVYYKAKTKIHTPIEGEIWRKIDNSNYHVSNFGRVKGCSGKILSPEKTNRGYLRVITSIDKVHKKYSVHRLVAKAFIANPDNKEEVNHKDGVKTNNHFDNLEWVTRRENIDHSLKNNFQGKNSNK